MRKSLLTTIAAFVMMIHAYAAESKKNPEAKLNYKFIENVGQLNQENAPTDIKFYIKRGLMHVYYLEDRVSYVLRSPNNPSAKGSRIDLFFENAAQPKIYGLGSSSSKMTYVNTSCPEGVSPDQYQKVVYEGIYENIDLVYYLSDDGALKYDFIVRPGGDPSDIKINYSENVDLALLDDGRIELNSKVGHVYEAAPYTYQDVFEQNVETYYSVDGNTISFNISEYDETKDLVIDPEVEWSTFFGGESFDTGLNSTIDANGDLYITGEGRSQDFPGIADDAFGNGENGDVFIGKFLKDGTHVWTIYYGGDNKEVGNGIATDDDGNVFVAGYTTSEFLPNPSGEDPVQASGNDDILILSVDLTGAPLDVRVYGSFSGIDVAEGIEHDGNDLYVTGYTNTDESEFPFAFSGYQPNNASDNDAFLFKLAENLDVLWATYYGGNAGDEAYGIGVDATGDPYIAGKTTSTDLPFDDYPNSITFGGDDDGDMFVAKFEQATGNLSWSNYYGGTDLDEARDLVVFEDQILYVGGFTSSTNLPIVNSAGSAEADSLKTYQDTYGGGNTDGALLRINAQTGVLQWTTYLGGSGDDRIFGTTVTGGAEVIVTGETESEDFPTENTDEGVSPSFNGGDDDVFITLFSDAGQVRYSGYVGGDQIDVGNDLTFYSGETPEDNNLYVIGRTGSENFPTLNAFQGTSGGAEDAFIYTLGITIDTTSLAEGGGGGGTGGGGGGDGSDPTIPPTDSIPSLFCDAIRNNVISRNPSYFEFADECLENIDEGKIVFYGTTPEIVGEGDFVYLYQVSANGEDFQNIRDEDGNVATSKNLFIGDIDLQRYFNLNDTLQIRRLVIGDECVDNSGTELVFQQDFRFAFAEFIVESSCQGQTIQLTDNSSITGGSIISYTYTIFRSDLSTETFTDANPEIGPYPDDQIRILLQVESDQGCIGISDTLDVDLVPEPQVSFDVVSNETGSGIICIGEANTVTFTANAQTEGEVVNYMWDLDNGETPSGPDLSEVSTTYTTLEDKTISLTVMTSNGCETTSSRTFEIGASENGVFDSPTVEAGADRDILEGERFRLQPTYALPAGQSDPSFLWLADPDESGVFPNNNPGEENGNIFVSPDQDTELTFRVTSDLGCVGEDSLMVFVEQADEDDIPNIFTPNDDGYNDFFVIPFLNDIPEARVEIFNRWGSLVYSTRRYYEFPWDGTWNGEPAPTGVYYYVISFPYDREELEGAVTLAR